MKSLRAFPYQITQFYTLTKSVQEEKISSFAHCTKIYWLPTKSYLFNFIDYIHIWKFCMLFLFLLLSVCERGNVENWVHMPSQEQWEITNFDTKLTEQKLEPVFCSFWAKPLAPTKCYVVYYIQFYQKYTKGSTINTIKPKYSETASIYLFKYLLHFLYINHFVWLMTGFFDIIRRNCLPFRASVNYTSSSWITVVFHYPHMEQ